ncbi:MAG: glycosyltransferase family 4 protein [Polaromonas sp.]|uniref:glycosyltransferase family 4 protein n=1 Tax=Polaromonas sp. TaxID=1869339 RepID=UPI0024898AE7|nr:glycosyltransferase family 4 protein [Polaromonas sp.]MDI1270376.1 glycosyltransferase family 4 protein [Polaromonas sp.]
MDTHLLTLLQNWPDANDRFVIFSNAGNQGVARIARALSKIPAVTLVSFPEGANTGLSVLTRVIRHFSLPLRFWLMKRRAQDVFSRNGIFDALLVDNGGYPGAWGSLAAVWAGAAAGIRTRMLLIHHCAIARAALRYNVESLIDIGVQRWATDLVAVSRATRETLIEQRGFFTVRNPIRVIHNGVDLAPANEEAAPNLRASLGIAGDAFVVGMVGRLERYKGQEDLVLALGELPVAALAKVVVVFVGSGETAEQQRLEAMAQKIGVASRVRFAGYVEGGVGALMRQFDLLAMLTKDFEGFGLTIAEAMSAGTPVMATRVGAVPEFVSTDIATLVQPEAPDEIAEALVEIMSNREETQRRAARARLHISKHSGQAMARKFHRLLLVSGG